MHQFCVGAAKGVLSPFVLQEIIMEALQRLNPAHVHNHLRTPAFHQLVQRCQQAYMQVTYGLSSCLSKLPGHCLPCRYCLHVCVQRGRGPWVLVAELVHCLIASLSLSRDSNRHRLPAWRLRHCTASSKASRLLCSPQRMGWFCVPCPLSSSLRMLPVPFNFCTLSLLCFQAPCPPPFVAYLFFFPCL